MGFYGHYIRIIDRLYSIMYVCFYVYVYMATPLSKRNLIGKETRA